MPTVEYRNVLDDVRIIRSMPVPKQMAKLEKWLEAARKAIPEIPDWPVFNSFATQAFVAFHLENHDGFKAAVTIDRSQKNGTNPFQ